MLSRSCPPWALGRLNSGASAPTSGIGAFFVRATGALLACINGFLPRILQATRAFGPRALLSSLAVRPIVTYGYMFSGTGSNVYVQNLCQEADPLAYGLVNEHPAVEEETIDHKGAQETSCPGRCDVETGGRL